MSEPRLVEVPRQASNALASAVAFDGETAGHSAESAQPGMGTFRLLAKTKDWRAGGPIAGFPA